MTIEQAKKKLTLARKKRDKINKEITTLNEYLLKKKKDALTILEKRNKEIYKLFLKNISVQQIASSYKLTSESIRLICRRMKLQEKKKKIVEAWINRNSN